MMSNTNIQVTDLNAPDKQPDNSSVGEVNSNPSSSVHADLRRMNSSILNIHRAAGDTESKGS